MLFRVLGPLAVEPDTGPLVLAGARSRALLTALLLAPGKLVPVHRLAEALWESCWSSRALRDTCWTSIKGRSTRRSSRCGTGPVRHC